MSDVLLVNPRSFFAIPSYLPNGLLYIAAVLQDHGIDVQIYDTNVAEEDFKDALERLNPKIIGFSILSGPNIKDAVKKSKIARNVCKAATLVWGGVHTTIFPEHVLREDFVDYIITNEGEYPFLELVQKILNSDPDVHHIANLGYKEGDKLHVNEKRDFNDMDALPLPAWDLVPIEKYVHNKFYANRVLTLHTSRGCPWTCEYCYNELVNDRKWRGLSAERTLEQIQFVKDKYNINGVQFYDDEFDANPRRVTRLFNLMIEQKVDIKFGHFSVTNIANETRYRLAKEAGCRFIEYGVESGSSRMLKLIRPQQTVELIQNAFDMCHRVGVKSGALFMVGSPQERKEDVDMTVHLVKSLKAHQTICTIFRPYPGNGLFNYCVENKLFTLPDRLEGQGDAYDIGSTEINVSEVETNYLEKAQSMYTLRNIRNEIAECLKHQNWSLLVYYMRKVNLSLFSHFSMHLLKFMREIIKGRPSFPKQVLVESKTSAD